jgi:hypothetical protein
MCTIYQAQMLPRDMSNYHSGIGLRHLPDEYFCRGIFTGTARDSREAPPPRCTSYSRPKPGITSNDCVAPLSARLVPEWLPRRLIPPPQQT